MSITPTSSSRRNPQTDVSPKLFLAILDVHQSLHQLAVISNRLEMRWRTYPNNTTSIHCAFILTRLGRIIGGADFHVDSKSRTTFPKDVISQLRKSGVSEAYLDVIKCSWVEARNMWELMDKLVQKQAQYNARCPAAPLSTYMLPSSIERQPYDRPGAWGRQILSQSSTAYRTELRAPSATRRRGRAMTFR